MAEYEPFPTMSAERFAALSSALSQYLTETAELAGDPHAYTSFHLVNADDNVDAFVLVAPHDGGENGDLVSGVAAAVTNLCRMLDGEPVVSHHYGEPRR